MVVAQISFVHEKIYQRNRNKSTMLSSSILLPSPQQTLQIQQPVSNSTACFSPPSSTLSNMVVAVAQQQQQNFQQFMLAQRLMAAQAFLIRQHNINNTLNGCIFPPHQQLLTPPALLQQQLATLQPHLTMFPFNVRTSVAAATPAQETMALAAVTRHSIDTIRYKHNHPFCSVAAETLSNGLAHADKSVATIQAPKLTVAHDEQLKNCK